MAVPGEQESFKSQTFSSPKRTTGASSAFASGQSGAAGSQAAKREVARAQYFDNRSDITADRLDRRIQQAEGIKSFKEQFTKPVNIVDPVTGKVTGTVTGLTQMTADAPRSLTDERIRLANKYGPTMSELAGDITYRAGKTLGAVADAAMTGKVGLFAGITAVSDYFFDKANKGYDNLNDVQKEIADNKDKYPLTSSGLPAITSMYNNERLALEAQRDAQKFAFAGDASGALGVDKNRLDGFVNEPIDTLSGGTMGPKVDLRSAKDYIDERESFNLPVFREPVVPAQEIKEAAMDRFSPEYLAEQQRQLEELNRLRQVEELKQDNIQIKDGEATPITDEEFKEKEEKVNKIFEGDDFFSQVTEFNNPGNLTDVGQAGTTGQTYGNGFAVFPTAQAGIKALENDLALKVNRSNKVEDIIGQYAAGDPNVGNYIDFVKNRVGSTVDQNELDDLRNAVIRFENKPDIAERYLALVADGGLMDKKMYGGIIGSKG